MSIRRCLPALAALALAGCAAHPYAPSAVHAGAPREDVLRLIGPPAFTSNYARPEPGVTWNYGFETPLRCIVFQVPFSVATGKVVEQGAYPSDPRCADEWM